MISVCGVMGQKTHNSYRCMLAGDAGYRPYPSAFPHRKQLNRSIRLERAIPNISFDVFVPDHSPPKALGPSPAYAWGRNRAKHSQRQIPTCLQGKYLASPLDTFIFGGRGIEHGRIGRPALRNPKALLRYDMQTKLQYFSWGLRGTFPRNMGVVMLIT